jgi:hypothetical protein
MLLWHQFVVCLIAIACFCGTILGLGTATFWAAFQFSEKHIWWGVVSIVGGLTVCAFCMAMLTGGGAF